MRILFTNTGSWGTGAGAVIDGVAKELIRLGHTVKVVFPDMHIPSADSEKYYGNPDIYRIIKFPLEYRGVRFPTFPLMIRDPNPRVAGPAWTYSDMSDEELSVYTEFLKEELGRLVEEFKPDIIETEHVWLMGYVLSLLGCPYVACAHHSDQIGFRFDERIRPYAIKCAQQSKFIFVISDFVKEEVISLYNVPKKNVIVAPNGYDEDIFRPKSVSKVDLFKRHNIQLDPSLPVVTFAGKFSLTKGIDVLLKANILLQERAPCALLLFGAGSIEDVLGRAPSEAEMKNVAIIGHVTQEVLSEFHNVSTFSVLPSREEGFSIAALEAMGVGLPVVGTRTGQLEKFIVGKIVSPGDEVALATAMESMLSLSGKAYQKLSRRATKVANKYSWQDNVNVRLKYYKKSIRDEF
jgi:glycosyltransferase involved in cell wall biosynthesis